MLKIGITGGIGTGKSVVCELIRNMGYPVFDTDAEAKKLMNHSSVIREKLIAAFGPDAYQDGMLNRSYLASVIFQDRNALLVMNSIVHPEVRSCFLDWAAHQSAPLVFFESAILFESDFYLAADKIWTVTAPEKLRYERVMKRDGSSFEKITERMEAQLPQKEKEARADLIIYNDGNRALIPQVVKAIETALGMN
ncbi:MAG: dephospho-CoA kinase [Bacteroidales bacterium]